ncbi:hypothetical protein [Almyronema epifaneia]|uniref:Uncharacterized protein n=1 Tax=Almyronema epifaneia S1 TaxID=2991925 RepID=A0ABW6IA23_9CYAN
MTALNPIITFLLQSQPLKTVSLAAAEPPHLSEQGITPTLQTLNSAFLILLAGDRHPEFAPAQTYLEKLATSPQWGDWAKFYLHSLQLITTELTQRCQQDPMLSDRFAQAATQLADQPTDETAIAEIIWSLFFPEGTGIWGQEAAQIAALRDKRTVKIDQLNPAPIQNPAKEILFTSNALLTVPLASADLANFDQSFRTQIDQTLQEPQLYWYDHPIPIGTRPENNEILYGLKNLNQAVAVERQRQPELSDKVNCVLSVSVTHKRLQTLGKLYLQGVLAAHEPLDHLKIFAFTEADTQTLIQQVLLPIVERCCPTDEAAELLSVLGVDGRYGRHYSFLKAIAALWQVFIDPDIKATFKIDLDQVFPQPELIEQTGASAFEHFQTPLWGATGQDATGQPIELGMIAGALVNQRDIHQGVFTPDVTFPSGGLSPDDYIFFSKLPQALSTEAEMMTRYQPESGLDGEAACLQRIHVTGGTNGILVESLRRFQAFTPSFIGRAEDQAYLLSTLTQSDRLGYAHAAGLIMRHDKEGFAQEAIAMAKVGKQIGDYLRILMFSAYAEALPADVDAIKALTNPFTGCFISHLPITVALLRFSLKVATLFAQGKSAEAAEFMRVGIPQLQECLDFTQGQPSPLQQVYEREQKGWQLFYRSLSEVEKALEAQADWAQAVQKVAQKVVHNCWVNPS